MSDHQALVQWLRDCGVTRLEADSRQVTAGSAFVAWPGHARDAREFVSQALQAGAVVALVEANDLATSCLPAALQTDPRVRPVADLKQQAGAIASAFFGYPSEALALAAVTGTNGKTSVSWWLAKMQTELGIGCGLVGTLGMGALDNLSETGLTTPDPIRLQAGLREMVDAGLQACAIEASSIGIVEHRLSGVTIQTAIWTNLSQDHLDYHGDMASYADAKARLFSWPGLRHAVINLDDDYGQDLAQRLSARADLDLWTVGIADHPKVATTQARLSARDVKPTARGTEFMLVEGEQQHQVDAPVVGLFNVSNLLCAAATLRAQGIALADIAAAMARVAGVPGRLERVNLAPQVPAVFIDYAHTPDAVQKTLEALVPITQARGGKLWCVLGCGGDRDKTKRAPMAVAAYERSDHLVVTSDNPRSEEPVAIIDDMLAGLEQNGLTDKPIHTIVQRETAIATAVTRANAADVVLIAGKGHESYQEIAGVRYPFSDMTVAQAALAAREPAWVHPLQCLSQLTSAQRVGDWTDQLDHAMRVHTDTRTLAAGDCFVALVGERFDAHAFLPQLKAAGVTVALASHGLAANGLSGVEVPDTRVALGEWADLWRENFSGPVIAVTGSNGKTTVTQMLGSITAAAHGEDALATQGNLNNDIGVPLTLLRLRSHHRSAVVELGMNHPGEIAYLAAMTRPTVALVNNAQREHLEFMGTVDAVAKENGSVFQSLSPAGVAVYPHADHYSDLWRQQAGGRSVFTFSCTDKQATVYASGDWQGDAWALTFVTPEGEFQASLALAGQHNVSNAAAAVACALAAGIHPDHITAGLDAFRAVKGRSRAVQLRRDTAVISLVDDTYNANPDSMRAAIDVLASLPKPRWLVMGDMGEVGAQGLAFHEEALRHAESQAIERIDVSGQWWRQVVDGQSRVAAHWHPDVEALSALAPEIAASYQSVLVKGSRFMRMERVVEALERAWPSLLNRPASKQEKEGARYVA